MDALKYLDIYTDSSGNITRYRFSMMRLLIQYSNIFIVRVLLTSSVDIDTIALNILQPKWHEHFHRNK